MIIETKAPISIEDLKKHFTEKDVSYLIDYSTSELKGKKLLTYLSNLDIPSNIKNVDLELVKEYLHSISLTNINSLENIVIDILFIKKGLLKGDSYKEFMDFMDQDNGNFVSSCVNQPPRYPLKKLVRDHFENWFNYIIDNIKPKDSLSTIVDKMNEYNRDNNLHRFNFHYLLMAADLANYVNLDTKINGLFDIDEWSECKLGPTAVASMKILKPGWKYSDFYDLCVRYNMKPMDLEDLLCVWLKYIKNPIWDFYIKPEHEFKDFENGWDITEKHYSYFTFKDKFENRQLKFKL